MPIYNKYIKENDYIVRMGAVNLLSMRYCGTNDKSAISELLRISATDLSSDVRR